MEHNKLFVVFLLLTIYALTVNKKIFIITFIFFISFLLYLNNKVKLSITFLIIYLLTLVITKKVEFFKTKQLKIEKFQPINDNEVNNKDNEDNNLEISNNLIQEIDSSHTMTSNNYQETFFILFSLLESDYIEKNKKNIENILVEYKINNLFDLSLNILNKDGNIIYNNLLEKITCISDNGNTNYLDCSNINYTKLKAFADLYLVYTLEIDLIIKLINVHKIYALCDLFAKKYILKDGEIETYQYYGLEYYINERYFNDKYFEILKILELTENLDNQIAIRETLYNYNDKNKKLVKDLNSILVLFDFFKVFDEVLLNYDELEYNWELVLLKSVDLNQPYWENISYFSDYDIKQKIVKAINKFTKTDEDIFSIELAEKCIKEEKHKEKEKEKEEEYKVLEDVDKCENDKEFVILKDLSIEYILKNFSKKIIDIINDLVKMFNKRCAVDCPENESKFGKYIFYIKEISNILSKDERLFFVGLLMVLLGIIFNFGNV